MRTLLHHLRASLVLITALSVCAVAVAGCSTGKANPEKADIGKTLSAEGWDVTLTGVPEVTNVVGESGITYQAKGVYQIVFLDVTNNNDKTILFPPDLVMLRDSEGNEYPPTTSTIQFAYLQTHSKIDLLIDSPVKPGDTRHTILIFDVPKAAEGLALVMRGVDDQISLGY
jgi:hypothetical protein